MTRPPVHLLAAGAIASGAAGQGTLTYTWSVTDTGNGDGIVETGENVLLTLTGTMDPHATGFAGSIFDIRGDANWQEKGVVVRHDNLLDDLTDDGTLHPDNSITGIEAFQLPPAFNPDFNAWNPIPLYSIEWQPNDYGHWSASIWDENHLNNDVYIDDFGSSTGYQGVPGIAHFDSVPAPSAGALLAVAGCNRLRCRRR